MNPVDSVMDLRQFLLDAPETCFYTSYDLILTAADGTKHQLADFYEIGDVADVTTGGCSLEMISGNFHFCFCFKLYKSLQSLFGI